MTDNCYECGGPAPSGWELCPICSVRAKLPSRPDLPEMSKQKEPPNEEMIIAVPPRVEHHGVPRDLLRTVHMIHRNGQLVQPGEHNDYTLDIKGETARIRWSVPLDQEETVCVFCSTTGARWAWSPHCGVFVDIRR